MKPNLFLRSITILLTLSLLFFSSHVFAQNSSVSGKVTDESGKGLGKVTVQVKGTNNGTTTSDDGTYKLSGLKVKQVLVFTYLGYESHEVSFNNQTMINIDLIPDTKIGEEVVVIGYGTQKKRNVTGAVSSFDARKVEERPLLRVDQALVGQLAGVRVKQTTGTPGNGFSIQVRGSGSISGGNEPLYVIDGFPLTVNSSNVSNGSFTTGNPLDNINPNDIESIEVLKDAAAAAIYGSRASNGVVIITTKQGRAGKAKISFNTYGGYNQTAKKIRNDEWPAMD